MMPRNYNHSGQLQLKKWLHVAVRLVIATILLPIPLLLYVFALYAGMWMFDGESVHGLGFYWRELRRWIWEPIRAPA